MFKYLIMLLALAWAVPGRAADVSATYLDKVFDRVGLELDVPPKLLKAICYNESHLNPRAYNQGDGRGTNHAFGVCQVLRETARDLGFKDPRCEQDFSDSVDDGGNLVLSPRDYAHCKLFGVYTNVLYAGMYLKSKLVEYDGNWISAIAAYNTGTLKWCKSGAIRRKKDHTIISRCHKGQLANQAYVNDVLKDLIMFDQAMLEPGP